MNNILEHASYSHLGIIFLVTIILVIIERALSTFILKSTLKRENEQTDGAKVSPKQLSLIILSTLSYVILVSFTIIMAYNIIRILFVNENLKNHIPLLLSYILVSGVTPLLIYYIGRLFKPKNEALEAISSEINEE